MSGKIDDETACVATIRATASVQSIDLTQLPAVAAAIIEQFRLLEFEHGAAVHPSTGIRIEGLANLSNSHPRVGSEYVIVTEREILPDMNDDEMTAFLAIDHTDRQSFDEENAVFFQQRRDAAVAAGTITTVHDVTNAKLMNDDRKKIAVEISTAGETPVNAEVRIEPPRRPTHAVVKAVATVPGHWFVAGDVDVDGHLDIEALCGPSATSTASAQLTARHRRGRGSIVVGISDMGLGAWTVDVTIRARGSGWFRPIAAIIGVVARPRLQRKFSAWLGSGVLDDALHEVRADLIRVNSSSPERLAAEIVGDLLDIVVETLPPAPLR